MMNLVPFRVKRAREPATAGPKAFVSAEIQLIGRVPLKARKSVTVAG